MATFVTCKVPQGNTCRRHFIKEEELQVLKRVTSSIASENVVIFESDTFIDAHLGATNHQLKDVDLIGPPDPISNLRPIIRATNCTDTILQSRLFELQENTQKWNHTFWSKHNNNFNKERQNFIITYQCKLNTDRQLTADEMSEFYKDFLDKNWSLHVRYNFEWYTRNSNMLLLALAVWLQKYILRIGYFKTVLYNKRYNS